MTRKDHPAPDEVRVPSTPYPSRARPVHGVLITPGKPTIVYVTVSTKDRQPWLASQEVHSLLCHVWGEASAWLVGRYVLMPDHIHLFAGLGQEEIPLDNWVRYWKSRFTKQHGQPAHRWQSGHWDTRLRSWESYQSKWEYVRNNPVRHGLVSDGDEWEFQGEINELRW